MVNSSQLFLLADHIKLSLLERQRAILLNIDPNAQDGQISRSLDSFREGLEALQSECADLEQSGNSTEAKSLRDQEQRLNTQYSDLLAQFRGSSSNASTTQPETLRQPNDPSLSADFANAKQTPSPSSTSRLKRTTNNISTNSSKSVRFSDTPSSGPRNTPTKAKPTYTDDEASTRVALFSYRDNPSSNNEPYTDADAPPDPSNLTNEQIHTYHSQVLREQDEQLDRLGESIGRQRELSIQIGDELDSQVQLLDDVDESVDRHQSRLNGARKRLKNVGKRARENWGLSMILILICILVLLIIILK